MSVNITGMNRLLSDLDERFGKDKMQRISDKALMDAAELFIKILNGYIGASGKYAKGWTVADTTATDPEGRGGTRSVKIHWNGPHGRYRLIHLNEYGTVRNPNPPRKGAIAKAMRDAEQVYRNAVKKAMLEGI